MFFYQQISLSSFIFLASIDIIYLVSVSVNSIAVSISSFCHTYILYLSNICHLNDSILRTFGALGMVMNREVAKNDMRLRASKLVGMSKTVSLAVSNKRRRLICSTIVWPSHKSIICGK